MSFENPSGKTLTWLITGCSSGFGLAMARIAQSHGHNVIATSRDPSRTPELVDEIISRGGKWVKLDLIDVNCGQVIDDFEAQGTAIDVLINTAAIGISGPLESFNDDEIRRIMETNFLGPYRLIRAAAPRMRKRRSGIIVNFSSGAGLEARQSLGFYGASKAALEGKWFIYMVWFLVFTSSGITKVLYKELQDFNVRVLLVCLGSFNTGMSTRVKAVAKPLDLDYDRTTTRENFDILTTGDLKVSGDHLKAVKVIYEVILGEGIGKGHEKELMLPLGKDMLLLIQKIKEKLTHATEMFKDVGNNVNVDGEDTLIETYSGTTFMRMPK
ncbi:putative short-chain oxidoreductase [Whalleya microplaca]|nr:putative short-chain oxidoreductase [Whalleya microplaca]